MSLTESEQVALYTALLRSLGQEAQDRLCARDARDADHAWGEWTRFVVEQDGIDWIDLLPVTGGVLKNECVQIVRSTRRCLNCGKEQTVDG